jgi:hypothetical protein
MNTIYNSASNRKVDAFEESTSSTVQENFEMTEWQSIEQKHPSSRLITPPSLYQYPNVSVLQQREICLKPIKVKNEIRLV